MSQTISRDRQRHLEAVDMLPEPLRQCVHEFGYPIVIACLQAGVQKPTHIRELVHQIWLGARQPAQRQCRSELYAGHAVQKQLDWLLIQSGSEVSAEALVRVLWMNGLLIVPREPNGVMLDASMAEVSGHTEVVTKRDKHRRRLRAAMDAAARRLWPHLFREGKS
jgi:hypothetical protein